MSYLLRQSPKLLPFHLKYSIIQNYSFSSISGTVCKSCFLNRKSFYTSPVSDLNKRLFCSGKLPHEPPSQQDPVGTALLDLVSYETICSDTLEGLCEYFDELVELAPHLKNADITYSDGVLTVNFGKTYGSYVINRQTPNRQIWLSSPTTGPKRYDFVSSDQPNEGYWIYKHDGVALHDLLQQEIGPIVRRDVDFRKLPYGKSS